MNRSRGTFIARTFLVMLSPSSFPSTSAACATRETFLNNFIMLRCMKERPTGIVLLASLEFISGILNLGITFYLLTFTYFPGNSVLYFSVFGVVTLILAYGLWIGKRWARTITFILSIVGILFWLLNILGILTVYPSSFLTSIINIFLNGVILYYLIRPHVKDYFK